MLLLNVKNILKAAELFTKSIDADIKENKEDISYNTYYNRRLVYEMISDYEKALEDFFIYQKVYPIDIEVRINVSKIYSTENHNKDAEKYPKKALEINEKNISILYSIC